MRHRIKHLNIKI